MKKSNDTAVLEVSFNDQNGEDLGSLYFERHQTVKDLIEDIVHESQLPTHTPDGAERTYEAYFGGAKLAPSDTVDQAGITTEQAVEIYPSVVTGGGPWAGPSSRPRRA